ncbi:hypothetical protein BGZ99_005577 [Dissophora globulifera]|uniref:Copper-fist domain-containing protein n=1 Tax=Dissophora globulifera TaxID=979702 RepID=A0A9P6UTI9_9FUNG|nr:hypothetical protein BGZ99_005577 [Dissophora globulifera]
MVFVNGQKFACATCIKGHRSTTCNHGERPLHEIKKKGRPSTQCLHCKELRKAKQVSVRCICGKEEATSTIATGLKRTKSLSHDGRLFSLADLGGEGVLRSLSTEGAMLAGSSDSSASPNEDAYSCGCLEGNVCSCCRDRAGHVVTRPGKGSTENAVLKHYQSKHQRSTASVDLGKLGMLRQLRDASPASLSPYISGMPVSHSPDDSVSSNSSLGLTDHIGTMGISANDPSLQLAQAQGSSSLSISSPLGGQQPPHLCFDYASSSDCDSDHYNPPTSYSYVPQSMANYTVGNASEDFEDQDLNTFQNNTLNRPTPSSILSGFGLLSPLLQVQLSQAPAPSTPLATKSCSSTSGDARQKGSCCSANNATVVTANDSSVQAISQGTQAMNLSQALSLIEANSQNASTMMDSDVRQALLGQNGTESVKMQHPTLLGDNGVLICGCGCGRPTVDCADCFRDMCEFVGESQARMMKEELDYEMVINREGGYLADLGLNMNMSMAMNMSLSMTMDMEMEMDMNDMNAELNLDQEEPQTIDQGLVQGQDTQSSTDPSSRFNHSEQQQRQQQQQQRQEVLEQEQRLRLQLMEQEQMQLSRLQPSALNQLQLDFLDDEDWSFVDEIRTDNSELRMPQVQST